MNQYRKTIAALVGALLTWGLTAHLPDGSIDRAEWWGLAVAVATALGVYQVRNEEPDERGAVDPGSCALGLLLGLLAGYLLWKNGGI